MNVLTPVFLARMRTASLDPTLLSATYSWPCENNVCFRMIPIFLRVCPCALFAVIANDGLTGNCLRVIWNGKTLSDGLRGILGIKSRFPKCGPEAILASIMWLFRALIMWRVPLQCPFAGSRFLSSMIMQYFFKVSLWGGIPEGHSVLMNSITGVHLLR